MLGLLFDVKIEDSDMCLDVAPDLTLATKERSKRGIGRYCQVDIEKKGDIYQHEDCEHESIGQTSQASGKQKDKLKHDSRNTKQT